MKYRYPLAVVMIVLIVGTGPALADLIDVNGSFENPDVPLNTMQPGPPTGWVGAPWHFDHHAGNPAWWPANASDGDQYADFGNKRSVVSSVDFYIGMWRQIAAISWDATSSFTATTVPYVVRLRNLDLAPAPGVIVRSADFTAVGGAEFNTWDTDTLPMIVGEFEGPHNYRLEFYADQDCGSDLLVDNVQIYDREDPDIPEPASFILLLGGSFLAIKRRRA